VATFNRDALEGTGGRVLHRAFFYDLFVALLSLGTERRYRARLISLAHLTAAESVLDVGCGTGTLAIAAKRCVGQEGNVHGVDPSPEMIRRARQKSRRAGVDVSFEIAFAAALPFPDATFDTLLCTAMLHHLPEDARTRSLWEMRRVLKPGGHLLAVDFGGQAEGTWTCARFAQRRLRYDLREQVFPLLTDSGFSLRESGVVRMGIVDWQYVFATLPLEAGFDRRDQGGPVF
jgi:ubiquinone/menaquinone biosynthesis C-methylase UbiE